MTEFSTRRRLLRLAYTAAPLITFISRASEKDRHMRRIFITGSTDGLGRAAAQTLMNEGHRVVLHARSEKRAAALAEIAPRAAGVVIGDLGSAAETRAIADQVNKIGRMDAVIHNAGIYREPNGSDSRRPRESPRGEHAGAVPAHGLIERPDRLIYLSSGMHRGGEASLRDIDWAERRWDTNQAYSDSKLYVTALAFAMAGRWPKVLSNAVDPGWVPTKWAAPGAGRSRKGHLTQTWLATSDDPAAKVSGGYWFHRKRQKAGGDTLDAGFQDDSWRS